MATAIGISQGCQPIWGFNYGAEAYDRVKRTYWKAFQIAMAVGIVFFLCFQFFPTQLVSIFGTEVRNIINLQQDISGFLCS